MRSRSLFSLLPFLLIPLSILQAQVTAIRAGTLIDSVSGTAARNQVILIEGKTMKALGPKGSPRTATR